GGDRLSGGAAAGVCELAGGEAERRGVLAVGVQRHGGLSPARHAGRVHRVGASERGGARGLLPPLSGRVTDALSRRRSAGAGASWPLGLWRGAATWLGSV